MTDKKSSIHASPDIELSQHHRSDVDEMGTANPSEQRRASQQSAPNHPSGLLEVMSPQELPDTSKDKDNHQSYQSSLRAGSTNSVQIPAPPVEKQDDGNVIGWDGDDDPENPYNWPAWRIRTNAAVVTSLAFLVPLASSIIAPGVPTLMREFEQDSELLSVFVVSVFVLGLVFGPLLFAPLSEIYGRLIVYNVTNLSFIAFNIGCALAPSLNSLIAFRFLAGFFGSCSLTNAGGTLADMLPPERRAVYTALFALGPLLGPVLGPVIAGFLAEAKGWRWTFWLVAIVSGFVTVILLVFGRETYAPALLQRRVDRLKKETGNDNLRHKLDQGLRPRERFRNAIVRPLKLLFLSPISIFSAFYLAIAYGYMYLMFSSVTFVFQGQYNFPNNTVGLVYLGLGVGCVIGLVFTGYVLRRTAESSAANGKALKPEVRMQLTPIGGILLPAGLFIYGWTAQYKVHWMAPIIGMVLMGIGTMIIFMSIMLYIMDCFDIYAASALAANAVVRSLGGALLPFAGLSMFNALGVGWGCSVLGFIAVAMIPVPVVFLRYGEYLRKRFEIRNL